MDYKESWFLIFTKFLKNIIYLKYKMPRYLILFMVIALSDRIESSDDLNGY